MAKKNENVATEKEPSKLVKVFAAWQKANSVEEAAKALDMKPASLQAFVSKYRNPEFEMTKKLDSEGRIVYQTNEDGSVKTNSQGKKVPVMVEVLGENGQPKIKRKGFPFKEMQRGRRVVDNYDETLAEMAAALDMSVEELIAQQS